MTRIFNVQYSYVPEYDGKGNNNETIKDNMNVVAKNAEDAIGKVKLEVIKPSSYIDDETKKRVKVTQRNFDPTGVTLEAEA